MNYYVYIIYNTKHDKFYIGQTDNLNKRIYEHKNKLALYTSKYDGDWLFLYYQKFKSRSEAMLREKFLKQQKNKDFYKNLCKNFQLV
jgi:putative endonuclease